MKNTLNKLAKGEHVTIVALGDSITEITFHTHGRMNWVGLLSEAIFEEYGNGVCSMINSGKCASTYSESLTRLNRDVIRFNPDLVILALGMNDAGRGLSELDTFKDDVRTIVARIRENRECDILIRTPNPVVTVHGLPLPKEQQFPGEPWETLQRPLGAYSEVLVALADELKCDCVDHYTLWTQKTHAFKHPVANSSKLWLRMGDAIHPGCIGHLAFFRELAPLFKVSPYFPWEERS